MVASIEPASIPLNGGDIVVRGSMFHPAAKVILNGMEVKCTQISDEILFAEAFSYPIPGEVSLYVRNPDGDSEHVPLMYTDVDAFGEYSSLISDNGPNTSIPGLIQEEETEEDDGKDIVVKKGSFKHSDPTISTIIPILSPPSGTTITITGYNFAEVVQVSIGGIITEETTHYVAHKDSLECIIKCQSPVLPEGFHNVAVINPKGGVARLEDVILYTPYDTWLQLTAPNPPKKAPEVVAPPTPKKPDFPAPAPLPPSSQRRKWG